MLTAPTRFNKRDLRKFASDTPALTMPDLAEFMTVKEAAQEMEFTPRGIHMLIKKSKIDALLVGRMYLVSKKSVQEYQEKTKGMGKNDPTRGKPPKAED